MLSEGVAEVEPDVPQDEQQLVERPSAAGSARSKTKADPNGSNEAVNEETPAMVDNEVVAPTSEEAAVNHEEIKEDTTVPPAEGTDQNAEGQQNLDVQPTEDSSGSDKYGTIAAPMHPLDYKRGLLDAIENERPNAPESYTSNSTKEQVILDYVENFIRQYKQIYPSRKDLLLLPKNEFGIRKFVCNTIRPTQFKFKELYDYQGCAEFVASYISYEPLEPPFEIPGTVPSPTFTLKVQSGNCFDCAILLASMLRGVGYDAYVVSGYASKEVTLMDDSRVYPGRLDEIVLAKSNVDEPEQEKKEQEVTSDVTTSGKYRLKPVRQLRSSFLAKQAEKQRLQKEKEAQQQQLEEEKLKKVSEKFIPFKSFQQQIVEVRDELHGLRVHAWVLVLPGKREIAESFFIGRIMGKYPHIIEPSTGRIYETTHHYYLGVESVFGVLNYWVNMQTCYDGLKGISFDLGDNTKWEFLFVENSQPGLTLAKAAISNQDDANASDEEDDEAQLNGNNVDLPPSWVLKMSLTQEQFENKSPAGRKIVLYKNAIVETFAEYHRSDGMIARDIFFADDAKTQKTEVHEFFKNRKDKLHLRMRDLKEHKIHEYFDPGRRYALKEQVVINGRLQEMRFYSSARSDGLVSRVETRNKAIEYFKEREDRLIYRSVTYDSNNQNGNVENLVPVKMTEKFERNPAVPASEDIAKRTFFLKDEKIRLVYHLETDRIIASYQEFRKPNTEQKGNIHDMITSFEVDAFAKPHKKQHLYAKLLNLLKLEQACYQNVKNSEREVHEIVQSRNAEERDIVLTISVYDTIRNKVKLPEEIEKENKKGEEEAVHDAKLDYLSPFTVNLPNVSINTRDEAIAIKDAALKSLKERLIEKANIIQRRHDEETAALQKAQMTFQKDQDNMTLDESEAYMRYCQEAMFRIQILEKRLQKHKETAPEKYIALDRKLRTDARLVSLLAQQTSN